MNGGTGPEGAGPPGAGGSPGRGQRGALSGTSLALIGPPDGPGGPARVSVFDPAAVTEPTPLPGVPTLVALPLVDGGAGLSRSVRTRLVRQEALEQALSAGGGLPVVLGRRTGGAALRCDLLFSCVGEPARRWWATAGGSGPSGAWLSRTGNSGGRTVVAFGSCLFSGRSLRLSGVFGEPLPFLRSAFRPTGRVVRTGYETGPSLYELDNAKRLSDTVARVVRLLGPGHRVRLVLDLPRTQYLLRLWNWWEEGAIGDRELRRLSALVEERTALVEELFVRCLTTSLGPGRRELVAAMTRADECGAILPATGRPAPGKRPPSVSELLKILTRDHAGWELATRLAPPGDLVGLVRMSHLTGALRTALQEDEQMIMVDDPAESGLGARAHRLLISCGADVAAAADRLGGLYPLSRLLVAGGRHGESYFTDPGGCFALPDGRRLTAEELVSWAYGGGIATTGPDSGTRDPNRPGRGVRAADRVSKSRILADPPGFG
ncbi:hypothetical protein ACIQ9E_07190 [Streptomyces sp. NPDC094448]|uniref:hypothetical protein n=1 Tax=Streptomyces sp. NPDC094448 TaxID=3366063 RepID=UPI00381AEF2D